MNILSFNVFLGKQLRHAYTKTTYQNQWSHRKQTTKNRVKDEHTANGTSPKSFDLSYDQTCRKNIKYAKTKKTTYFWGPGGVTLSKKRVVQRTALIHTPVFWRVKAFLCNVVCT
jgi:hypothetical protein